MGNSSSEQSPEGDTARLQEAERIEAEAILLTIRGPDGREFIESARLNGTLNELIEKVAAKCGVTAEFVHLLELHFCDYQLEPASKTVREFTELCPVGTAL